MKKRYILGIVGFAAFLVFYAVMVKYYANCTPYMLCIFNIPFISNLGGIIIGGALVFTFFLMLYFLAKSGELEEK